MQAEEHDKMLDHAIAFNHHVCHILVLCRPKGER